ncbi:TetR/AcrR family transcriptional regulator [Falsirhodobacter sp. alg1]|uniref:TetR/AcrR family transcriptional regulator n=1 Tax=Falsirhodobacter sp. alg1 TaxID=1472418 RepID=UPI000694AAD5|nr:TetR/AcrR family transcriptional regulator [Falsirhodobacter sp. alg1]
MTVHLQPRPRGRPRGFDAANALEQALRVFWTRGYDQASVDLLCSAMEMPRATMYSLFGDKDGLFLAVVSHYAQTRLSFVAETLSSGNDLLQDLHAFFKGVVQLSTAGRDPAGCLISCVLADVAATNAEFRDERNRRFDALEQRLEARLLRDGWPTSGSCPANVAASLAAAMARGIVQRGRTGQSADDLYPVAISAAEALYRMRDTLPEK